MPQFLVGVNSPNPLLANIILFGFFSFQASSQGFKTRQLGRDFHIFIKNVSLPSPTNVGSHNPPPLGAQHPHWHITWCLAMIPFVIVQAYR